MGATYFDAPMWAHPDVAHCIHYTGGPKPAEAPFAVRVSNDAVLAMLQAEKERHALTPQRPSNAERIAAAAAELRAEAATAAAEEEEEEDDGDSEDDSDEDSGESGREVAPFRRICACAWAIVTQYILAH